MGKGTIERFGLKAIVGALDGSDVATAREKLSELVNSVVEVSGTVQKRVKRDGQCKLVIEPGDVPGFVVFADCQPDAEKVQARKIRKGSPVAVRGKFQTFGASAVCLSDCRLQDVRNCGQSSRKFALKKENGNLS
jgi:RPA family protein